MHSLSTIPEPSNNKPSVEPTDDAVRPLIVTDATEAPAEEHAPRPRRSSDQSEDDEQMVDHLAVLLLLLIAGALLRVVLGLLGPLQGIDETRVSTAQQSGRDVLSFDSDTAFPLFDLLAVGQSSVGLPAWLVVALGSLFTLASIPSAYLIGRTLTGRGLAGIVAAGVVAVHPAVLAVSNAYDASALALGLVTVGLALICLIKTHGKAMAVLGGLSLGLAGLAAPLCWLIGAAAGPITAKLNQRAGLPTAVGLGLVVTILAVGPTVAYRSAYLGHHAGTFFVEGSPSLNRGSAPSPTDQLLVAMTSTSFTTLGEAMHLPLGDAGRLKVVYTDTAEANTTRDPIADGLADGWLLLNAALAGLAAISLGVLLARRRFAETFLFVLPLAAIAFSTLPPTESLRLPMLSMLGVLAAGLFATRSVPDIDQTRVEAKRLAKLAKQEAKERAKQERELKKHKESLYAFDQPKPRSTKTNDAPKREPATPAPAIAAPEQAVGILTEHEEEQTPMSARPI